MYAQDYEETYPLVGGTIEQSWPSATTTPAQMQRLTANGLKAVNGWALNLLPYTKNREIFQCPSMDKTFSGSGDCAAFNGQRMTNHYAYNYFLGADDSYPGYALGRTTPATLASLSQPANVISHFHAGSVPPYGKSWGCVYVTIEMSDFYDKIRPRLRHKDGDNFAFARWSFQVDSGQGSEFRSKWNQSHQKHLDLAEQTNVDAARISRQHRRPPRIRRLISVFHSKPVDAMSTGFSVINAALAKDAASWIYNQISPLGEKCLVF